MEKMLGQYSAVLAFTLCLAAGAWLLIFSGFNMNDPIATGLGLYFVGKAFFVGPMLYHTYSGRASASRDV
ncbi:MAG: hypothetical protein HKN13_01955 [Rhodothermales bacterium]|nr:hypothetical protein [Rhodothermales bacterium]